MRPYLVIEWNDTETEAVGWLCIYNFVNHTCAGGIRMHPTVNREEVIRLATGMAYKQNSVAYVDKGLKIGGCKSGIKYDYTASDAFDVLKRFLAAIAPYITAGVLPGGDLGVPFTNITRALQELGVVPPKAVSEDEGSTEEAHLTIDLFDFHNASTGYGTAFAADESWRKMGHESGARVVVQGFGSVGAACAYKLQQLGYKIVGISDAKVLVSCPEGLDVEAMVKAIETPGLMNQEVFDPTYKISSNKDWLEVDCDILIPAALEDVINLSTYENVKAHLIVEGANIPISHEADSKIKKSDIIVIPDFIANQGGVKAFNALSVPGVTSDTAMGVIEELIRTCVSDLMDESKKTSRYTRDIALEMFAPTVQETPTINL